MITYFKHEIIMYTLKHCYILNGDERYKSYDTEWLGACVHRVGSTKFSLSKFYYDLDHPTWLCVLTGVQYLFLRIVVFNLSRIERVHGHVGGTNGLDFVYLLWVYTFCIYTCMLLSKYFYLKSVRGVILYWRDLFLFQAYNVLVKLCMNWVNPWIVNFESI